MLPKRSTPGLIISLTAHVSLLALTLVAFSSTPKFEEAQENIPVEMISTQAFSQIAKGEKTAKESKPVQKADKMAEVAEIKPTPPLAEAKKDVPLPPPPLKRIPDPGDDNEPKQAEPQKTAALPPPPIPTPPVPAPPLRPAEPEKAAPAPPERPSPPKVESKPEPKPEPKPIAKQEAKPEEDKPDDAEPLTPKPTPRPKTEAKSEPKPEPKPAPKPPEKPPEKAAAKPVEKPPAHGSLQVDQVARILAQSKASEKAHSDKPVSKPKSGEEQSEPKEKFNAAAISRLLDKDKAQTRASTGREVVHTASLGAPNANAQKMAPNMMDALNGLMMEQYRDCWNYFGAAVSHNYVPRIRVRFQLDGALAGEPILINPTSDPALSSLADAAMRAVRKCNPLRIPTQYQAFFHQWKERTIAFDPADMR